ncbi:acyltransferase family protein [Alkaliflexus imshenetskii]|uniref:acyltransferase family protein n=1 Tax=Alkaliflexus imshenetskii TaxID=286730 RepID=UPI00047B7060|nr:acyltransferase family protein [Alkaliflexus imshenetskii]
MRRQDLDWLRVIVFAILIFYHVGMFFVPWDFHIKNNVLYHWLVYPMWFVNQWRLPILFVISGMGTYYALQKRSGKAFVWERIKRLYIPLAFGMAFIIPPQVYIERIAKKQFAGNYFDFWLSDAFSGVYPNGNFSWHHLWFLVYLLLFSLVLTPIFLYLKNHQITQISLRIEALATKPLGLYAFIIPLFFIESFIEPFFPVTHALVGDWFTIINYLTLFLFGFLLVNLKEVFWSTVEKNRKYYLILGVINFSLLLFITHFFEDSVYRHFPEALIKVVNLWSWILALFGFASKHLNRNSNALKYSNEAVYPFYILHQTVMIIVAYYLIDLNWSLGLKSGIMIISTFGFTWLIYELLIRRWRFIRPLFGLKNQNRLNTAT